MFIAKREAGPVSKKVLDANILQYLQKSSFADQLTAYITGLRKGDVKPKISEVSLCELLSGCNSQQESASLKVIEQFEKYSIDRDVLTVAAKLQNIYRSLKVEFSQIGLADRIIAATVIVMGTDILTANVNDFPRPLFREKHEELFLFKRGYKTCLQVVQILSPNWELVESYLTDEG